MQLTSEDLERCRPRVMAFLSRHLSDPNEVEDVTQNALLKAWETAHKCRNNDPCAWAVGVARFVLFRHYRGEQRYRRNSRDDWQEAFHDPGITDAPSLAVTLATLAPLRPATRMMFFLHHLCGWSYADVSAELGVSENAIEKRLRRARRNLRETAANNSLDVRP